MEIHGSKGSIHVTRSAGELLDFAPVLLIKGTETEGIMDKVRIAIVGCGNISQLNVPGYPAAP